MEKDNTEKIPDWFDSESRRAEELLNSGQEVNNPSAQKIKKKDKKNEGQYMRIWLKKDTVDLLYDIIWTEQQKKIYTHGKAIEDGLKCLSENTKLEKAPEWFKKQKK